LKAQVIWKDKRVKFVVAFILVFLSSPLIFTGAKASDLPVALGRARWKIDLRAFVGITSPEMGSWEAETRVPHPVCRAGFSKW
jgi:hypothetical protein